MRRGSAVPFRQHASVTCPPPAALAASMAWELGDLDPERVERAYDALLVATPIELEPTAEDQLRALGEAPLRAVGHGGPEALLLDRALERGHGHPMLIAVLLAELGRRAGVPVGVVAGAAGHFVAHQRLTQALVLDPSTGQLVNADGLGVLQWRCGHQVAAELLDELQPRYERIGDLARALHVARMRTTLPFEDTEDAALRLKQLAARLN
ncbi:transglutaminase-like domain-containing protein [Solirubrobacter taibaiensis]|nr:transglutaminase-like domain-containing protein [Solirubrobacter taibaiensis]